MIQPGLLDSDCIYDAAGNRIGRSDATALGGYNHYDSNGRRIGHTDPGCFGISHTELEDEDDKPW